MINATEKEEREYLEEIKDKLALAIKYIDDTVKQFSEEMRQKKQYWSVVHHSRQLKVYRTPNSASLRGNVNICFERKVSVKDQCILM
jgi:hypothetical protein